MSQDARSGVSRRRFLVSTGAVGAAAVAGCTESSGSGGGGDGGGGGSGSTGTAAGDQLSGEITITGSSTVYPLAVAVANRFQEEHSQVDPSVSSTGSGGGFSNHFCVGNSDLNNASRPIKEEEQQLCEENGVDYHEIKVATDAVTVVVNNENDWVDNMTVD